MCVTTFAQCLKGGPPSSHYDLVGRTAMHAHVATSLGTLLIGRRPVVNTVHRTICGHLQRLCALDMYYCRPAPPPPPSTDHYGSRKEQSDYLERCALMRPLIRIRPYIGVDVSLCRCLLDRHLSIGYRSIRHFWSTSEPHAAPAVLDISSLSLMICSQHYHNAFDHAINPPPPPIRGRGLMIEVAGPHLPSRACCSFTLLWDAFAYTRRPLCLRATVRASAQPWGRSASRH